MLVLSPQTFVLLAVSWTISDAPENTTAHHIPDSQLGPPLIARVGPVPALFTDMARICLPQTVTIPPSSQFRRTAVA